MGGKSTFFNTETKDFDRAERLARAWFARLKSDSIPGSRPAVTMHAAAKDFIKGIRKPVRKEYHEDKWNAISDFFKAVDVDAVDTPLLKKFLRWRRGQDVSESTVAKSLVTIRLVLRHSVEEGWLDKLPLFPKLEKIETNPRPWLEASEWAAPPEESGRAHPRSTQQDDTASASQSITTVFRSDGGVVLSC